MQSLATAEYLAGRDVELRARVVDARPPDYPLPIDRARAAHGVEVYKAQCAYCHGASGQDFSRSQ